MNVNSIEVLKEQFSFVCIVVYVLENATIWNNIYFSSMSQYVLFGWSMCKARQCLIIICLPATNFIFRTPMDLFCFTKHNILTKIFAIIKCFVFPQSPCKSELLKMETFARMLLFYLCSNFKQMFLVIVEIQSIL